MIQTDNRPIYVKLADQICDRILLDEYRKLERIPSVREYAVSQQVNPATAARAFEMLERQGVIQKAIRDALKAKTETLIALPQSCQALKDAGQKWLDTYEDGKANADATKEYIAALENSIKRISPNPKRSSAEWRNFLNCGRSFFPRCLKCAPN